MLASGFDEEASGLQDAHTLGTYLEKTYGENSAALFVDEGSSFGETLFGSIIATPGVGEKGYYDTHVQCLAAHTAGLPADIKRSIKDSATSDSALKRVEDYFFQGSSFKSLAGTTQAIDLIGCGNALAALKECDASILAPLAKAYNLSYNAFGVQVSDDTPKAGALTLSDAFNKGLEPAPVAPTGASAYALLSGTIKATYNAHRGTTGDNIAVAPGIMSGNTDTRYYWKLTEHIFRYNHHNAGKGDGTGGVHTVNENLELDSFLEMIRFFTTLILNADESTSL
ncbi:hypothetical protein PLICRDRAFT_177181 [Plicaturopsis crispa FD-325 SS-3]|nr:hypothetical protein PLICRDRAFT_177181 [Plicaturopsis crispa FD-325 SS-3]